MNKMSRKVCFEAGYKQCKHDVLGLIDEMKLKIFEEGIKDRATGYFQGLEELKARING